MNSRFLFHSNMIYTFFSQAICITFINLLNNIVKYGFKLNKTKIVNTIFLIHINILRGIVNEN